MAVYQSKEFSWSEDQLKIITGDQYNSCTFNDCVFDHLPIIRASFFLCVFNKCSFINCNIRECVFIGCTFNLINFNCAKLGIDNTFDRHTRFIDCLNVGSFRQIKNLIVDSASV